MSDQSERRVGFASPPQHSRFKKGKSGNPRGRPKKQTDLWTLLGRVLNRKVKLQGSDQQILIREALIRRLRDLALSGDRRALDLQRRIMDEAGDGGEERSPPVDTKKLAEFLNKFAQDRKAKEENPDG
jgi:uncharacterized protein DUF5681